MMELNETFKPAKPVILSVTKSAISGLMCQRKCLMIKMTYLPVSADCAEDQGLLLDDFLVSCVLKLRYRSCPSDKLLNRLFVSVPPSLSSRAALGAVMTPYCWVGSSSSVPNRTVIYRTKQSLNRLEQILGYKDLSTWGLQIYSQNKKTTIFFI